MDRNLQAQSYLDLLSPERMQRAQDIAFKSQLQRIRFDYSLESLARIDEMLLDLRKALSVGYDAFLARQPAVNFVAALNFYVGATIAQTGNFALQWVDHATAVRYIPGLPRRMEADLGCVMGDGIYFPATVVTEILFDAEMERTCVSFAQHVTERLTLDGHRLPDVLRPPAQETSAPGLSATWREALEGAGLLGARGMGQAAAGAHLMPVALHPGAGGTHDFVGSGVSAQRDLEAAIADGLSRLDGSVQRHAWQALAYDGFVNLPLGRKDAVLVELRVYERRAAAGSSSWGGLLKRTLRPGAVRTSLGMTLALPYRPPSDKRGFANFAPRIVTCTYLGGERRAAFDAFYRGLLSSPDFAWMEWLVDE